MPVNDEEYKQIWSFYRELGVVERHFDNLQARYRALASTWLLAGLAGSGFVLSERPNLLIPRELIIAGIGVGGSIGIYLLWVLDLLFYHRLLDAAYIEARNLETTHQWLPQVRNNIRGLLGGKGLSLVVWFYVAGTEVMALIGGVGLFLWLISLQVSPVAVCLIATGYVIAMGRVLVYMRRRTSTTPNLESQVEQLKGGPAGGSLGEKK
jgi:hypothetical protein